MYLRETIMPNVIFVHCINHCQKLTVIKIYRIILNQYYQLHGGCENLLNAKIGTAKSGVQNFNIRTIQYWVLKY